MSTQEISDFITIIRPQFMTFCKDACRSATFNHMLFRLAWKCKDQPKEKIQAGEVLWYAKNEQITSEMSNAWGVCKVRKEVEALVQMNLIGKRKNPAWGADRTKHFCFGSEQCAVFLNLCKENNICVVHLDLPAETKHLIYSSVANDISIKCSCPEGENAEANDKCINSKRYNHQMEMIEISVANDTSIEAIPKNTTKTTDKEHTEDETYPRDSQTLDDSGSSEPTRAQDHAPTTHAQNTTHLSEKQPEKPSHAMEQESTEKGNTNAHASGNNAARSAAAHENGRRVAQDMQAAECAAGSVVTEMASQLLTVDVDKSAVQGGKVAPEVDVSTLTIKAHTSYVFRWLDEIRQECEKDSRASYAQTKTAERLIADLIGATLNTCNEPTREHVRMTYREMWDQPTSSDGFSWKHNISIKSFCKHFDTYLGRARRTQRAQAQRPGTNNTHALPSHHHQSDDEYYASLRRQRT